MSLFDYITYQWTKGDKNWHIPYNNALTALKDFLGDKGTNADLGGGLTSTQTEITNARGAKADLQARIDPIDSEVQGARGTTASLSTRLASVINPDGTPVAGASVAVEFKASGDTPTFLTTTSFKIPTDKTATYVKNRKVRLTLGSGDVIAAITSSSFASPDTTVVVDSAVIDNTISAVAYGIDSPASAPKNPQIDLNTDMSFWNAERNSIDAGLALLMDKGWIDAFDLQNQQGADEAGSVGFAYDMVSKFYKGIDGGIGINKDFPFTVESDYLQKEFTKDNASPVTSQATFTNASPTVTISSGAWPVNALNMRITPDGGTTWFDILSRDSATQITLTANFTGTTGAKDYIIRPTEFVSGIAKLNEHISGLSADRFPQMTSDTTPSGVVSASSEQNQTTAKMWQAFDNDFASSWFADFATDGQGGTLNYDFGAGITKLVKQYTLAVRNDDMTRAPKTWTFEGSNDGTNWTVIDTQSNITGWTANVLKVFSTSANTNSYRHFRIKTTANNIGTNSTSIAMFEIIEDAFSNPINEPSAIVPAHNKLINISGVTDFNSIAITETLNNQTAKYAFIHVPSGISTYNDPAVIVAIFNQTGGIFKRVIKWTGTKWQKNTDINNDARETWTDATGAGATDIVHALSEAIDGNAALSMAGADVVAVTDAEFDVWFLEDATRGLAPSNIVASQEPVGFESKNLIDDEVATYYKNTGATFPVTIRLDFGASVTKVIDGFLFSYDPAGWGTGNLPNTFTFEGSNDNNSSPTNWTIIDTFTNVSYPAYVRGKRLTPFTSINTTAYRHYRFNITNSQGADLILGSIELYEKDKLFAMYYGVGAVLKSTVNSENPNVDLIRTNVDAVRTSMTFQSKTFDPAFVPAEGYLWARAEHSNADGPGTFYVSRDGGTTWTAIPMVQQGNPISGNIRIMRGTLAFTTEPSGQDFRSRYVTAQAKDQFLHSWGLQARQ